MPAEPERIGKRIADIRFHAFALRIIKIAVRVVDHKPGRRVDKALLDRLDDRDELHAARRAEKMADHRFRGVDLHLPRVVAERRSTSTEENFTFARELLRQRGLDADTVAYATNAFHCYRAGQYARMAGFAAARAVPAKTPLRSALPCYLREVPAVLYYWAFRRIDGGPLQGVVGLMSLQKKFFYKSR